MPQDLTDDKSTLVQVMACIGAVRQQAITWASVDPDRCRHMASLGPNELNSINFYVFRLLLSLSQVTGTDLKI